MKRNIITVLVVIAIAYTAAEAQVTGGGSGNDQKQSAASSTDKGVFDNAFYLKFGMSLPMGSYGKKPTSDKTIRDSYSGLDGMGATTGGTFEMGTIFYLHDLPLSEQFKIGIDVSWLEFSWNAVDWSDLGPNWESNELPFLLAEQKIGPAFSYNPALNFVVDAYVKFGYVIGVGGEVYYYERLDYDNTYSYYTQPEPGAGMVSSFGLNARYSALMLGLEFSRSKLTRDIYESETMRYQGSYNYNSGWLGKTTTPIRTMQLSFGFKF